MLGGLNPSIHPSPCLSVMASIEIDWGDFGNASRSTNEDEREFPLNPIFGLMLNELQDGGAGVTAS